MQKSKNGFCKSVFFGLSSTFDYSSNTQNSETVNRPTCSFVYSTSFIVRTGSTKLVFNIWSGFPLGLP